jgi:RNA polymerase sigma-70 factor (ECF subfamily)
VAEIDDRLFALHQRLRTGEPTASEALVRLVLPSLTAFLAEQFPRVDEQVRWDGAVDALLAYGEASEACHASTGGEVRGYLQTIAWRRVANSLRATKRRRIREERTGQLAVTNAMAEYAVELASPAGTLLRNEEEAERAAQLAQLRIMLIDERDWRLLELRLDGERRTEVFAELLGITHRPLMEQRTMVKRAKDRIDKAMRRAAEHARGRS